MLYKMRIQCTNKTFCLVIFVEVRKNTKHEDFILVVKFGNIEQTWI